MPAEAGSLAKLINEKHADFINTAEQAEASAEIRAGAYVVRATRHVHHEDGADDTADLGACIGAGVSFCSLRVLLANNMKHRAPHSATAWLKGSRYAAQPARQGMTSVSCR